METNGWLSRHRSRFSPDIPAFHPVIPAKAGIQRAADANGMVLSDIASAIIGGRGNP